MEIFLGVTKDWITLRLERELLDEPAFVVRIVIEPRPERRERERRLAREVVRRTEGYCGAVRTRRRSADCLQASWEGAYLLPPRWRGA